MLNIDLLAFEKHGLQELNASTVTEKTARN
jgi:hypothetical protein